MANHIHASAIIGPDVELGDENVVGPGAILMGRVRVGSRNWIGPGVILGGVPDIYGYPKNHWEFSWETFSETSDFGVSIGSGNVFKEFVTVHAGSHRDTVISSNCYLMPRSHLGHDCWVGDSVMLSPSVQVAGHVAIGRSAVLGMGSLVHQFSAIGPVAMIGMGAVVRGQVEPCRTVVGEPHRVSGINKVGLGRFLGDVELVPAMLKALKNSEIDEKNCAALANAIAEWNSHIVVR
jgi:UDP-N-acetylglucosamine acyltransferase